MANQTQKAGDNSTNIQIVHHGLSVTEARQIFLDMFQANFLVLAGLAKDTAQRRAEEITEVFLKKLREEYPAGLLQAQDPDFQHGLFTVQKEFARCGDKYLGDLLVDLLVDRAKHPTRSILQIVLNESLTVALKLTPDQLAALSLIFLFQYTIKHGVKNHQLLWEYLDSYVQPFAPLINPRDACYQHLQYSGCGVIGIGTVNLAKIFLKKYGGLFSHGFDMSHGTAMHLSIPESHSILTKCLNNDGLLQVKAMREDVVRSECARLEVSTDDTSRLVTLHNERLMSADEVKKRVIKERGYMQDVFEVWEKSSMSHFTLTSVGIAIAHANVKKNVGEFTDLSIWIN